MLQGTLKLAQGKGQRVGQVLGREGGTASPTRGEGEQALKYCRITVCNLFHATAVKEGGKEKHLKVGKAWWGRAAGWVTRRALLRVAATRFPGVSAKTYEAMGGAGLNPRTEKSQARGVAACRDLPR